MKTDTIDVSMLSRLTKDQLGWIYNYMNSIEEEEDGALDLYSIPGTNAVQLNVIYCDDECADKFKYIIDIDGIALRKES